jgi:hypothetical protein
MQVRSGPARSPARIIIFLTTVIAGKGTTILIDDAVRVSVGGGAGNG